MKNRRQLYLFAISVFALIAFLFFYTRERPNDLTLSVSSKDRLPTARVATETVENESIRDQEPTQPSRYVSRSLKSLSAEDYLELELLSVANLKLKGQGITRKELQTLLNIYAEFQEIRVTFEKSLFQIVASDDRRLSVSVPPYPVEGSAMRELFHQRLKTEFSREKYEKIDDYLGEYFDQRFSGFGISKQTITVEKEPNSELLKITKEVVVSPGLTPSGIQTEVRFGGNSSTSRLSRDQLKVGEFSFIEPLIRK